PVSNGTRRRSRMRAWKRSRSPGTNSNGTSAVSASCIEHREAMRRPALGAKFDLVGSLRKVLVNDLAVLFREKARGEPGPGLPGDRGRTEDGSGSPRIIDVVRLLEESMFFLYCDRDERLLGEVGRHESVRFVGPGEWCRGIF